MALSRDPAVPVVADIGDPPLVEPGAEVAVRHPLRLCRLPAGSAPTEPMDAVDVTGRAGW